MKSIWNFSCRSQGHCLHHQGSWGHEGCWCWQPGSLASAWEVPDRLHLLSRCTMSPNRGKVAKSKKYYFSTREKNIDIFEYLKAWSSRIQYNLTLTLSLAGKNRGLKMTISQENQNFGQNSLFHVQTLDYFLQLNLTSYKCLCMVTWH